MNEKQLEYKIKVARETAKRSALWLKEAQERYNQDQQKVERLEAELFEARLAPLTPPAPETDAEATETDGDVHRLEHHFWDEWDKQGEKPIGTLAEYLNALHSPQPAPSAAAPEADAEATDEISSWYDVKVAVEPGIYAGFNLEVPTGSDPKTYAQAKANKRYGKWASVVSFTPIPIPGNDPQPPPAPVASTLEPQPVTIAPASPTLLSKANLNWRSDAAPEPQQPAAAKAVRLTKAQQRALASVELWNARGYAYLPGYYQVCQTNTAISLEKRGLLRVNDNNGYYITEAGREALKAATKGETK